MLCWCILYILCFLLHWISCNTVNPSCPEYEAVCEISLNVSPIMTMTYTEDGNHINIVIVYPNGTAVIRETTGCDKFKHLSDERK